MKKKTLICLLVLCALLLTACSGKSTNASGSDAETTQTALVRGTTNGSTYQNNTIGYGVTLVDWIYTDADTINSMNNWSGDMTDDELQATITDSEAFVDMAASSSDELRTVNVTFQNMDKVYSAVLSEQEVVDREVAQMPDLLAQAGYTNVQLYATTVNIGGDEHPGLMIQSVISDVAVYQKQACIQAGSYIAIITATSFTEDHTDEILSQFYKF